jgi:sigma-B regulation protein RsbU (phosphoserine phosphatase)
MQTTNLTATTAMPDAPIQRRVLVVDDSRSQRLSLRVSLRRWGYDVTEAASGEEALAACGDRQFDFVLSDWVMPGISGLDLCRAFRAMPRDSYGYYILLTSKSGKDEVALGLDAGADDFLSKPVSADELRARMQAGERILQMQAALTRNNHLLADTLAELRALYDSLDRDLIEARRLQQALVRDRHRDFGTAAISVLLRPSGHVGGDLVGYFQPDPDRLVFFSIDVSGHGVAAGMMAARLAGILSNAGPEGAIPFASGPKVDTAPPAEVVARLNRSVIESMRVDQYFTCIYAEADLRSGVVSMVQAGHPHPLMLRASGRIDMIGTGGLPVGLVADARYQSFDLCLEPGDRLLMMSDGLTECADPSGTQLGEDGMIALVRRHLSAQGAALLDALQWDVERHAGGGDPADDMSSMLFEYRGPQSEQG